LTRARDRTDIGASASCPHHGSAVRFAFVQGSFLSFSRAMRMPRQVPALSLSRTLRNRRVLSFLGIWFGVNICSVARSRSVPTAQRRLAGAYRGFLAGLMLFSLFDRCRGVSHAADASSLDRLPNLNPPRLNAACGAGRFHPSSSYVVMQDKAVRPTASFIMRLKRNRRGIVELLIEDSRTSRAS